MYSVIGSPTFPTSFDVLRLGFERGVRYGVDPQGTTRESFAIPASGDRRALNGKIAAPTLVIYGADDFLVPVAAGRHTAAQLRARCPPPGHRHRQHVVRLPEQHRNPHTSGIRHHVRLLDSLRARVQSRHAILRQRLPMSRHPRGSADGRMPYMASFADGRVSLRMYHASWTRPSANSVNERRCLQERASKVARRVGVPWQQLPNFGEPTISGLPESFV